MMLHSQSYLLIRLDGNNKSSGKDTELCVGDYAEHSPSQLQESWKMTLINQTLESLIHQSEQHSKMTGLRYHE